MLLTSHVPGQEAGNAELVARAAAGRRLPRVRDLVAEIGRLREDPEAVDAMRAASARMSRPGAASDIAALIADLVAAGRATRRAGTAGAAGGNDIDGTSMRIQQHRCSTGAADGEPGARGPGREDLAARPAGGEPGARGPAQEDLAARPAGHGRGSRVRNRSRS
jgi:hypothetical protein